MWNGSSTVKCRLDPGLIHIFNTNGKSFLFLAEETNFFLIDDVAKEVLNHWNKISEKEIKESLSKSFNKKEIVGAIKEVKYILSQIKVKEKKENDFHQSFNSKPRVKTLTLMTVAGCNLACRYCWNQGGLFGRDENKLMTLETAKKAIKLAVNYSRDGDNILIDFYGGEPLLNWHLIEEVIENCEEIEKKIKRKFSYKITTNGTMLTDEMVAYLRDKPVELAISLDGPREVHDFNRHYVDGKGTWDEVYPKVSKLAKEEDIHLSLRATLAPPDIDMVEVAKFLHRTGVLDTEVEFADEPDSDIAVKNFQITIEDSQRMREEYFKFAAYYLEKLVKENMATDIGLSNTITHLLSKPRASSCGAGLGILCVSVNGEFYPCLGLVGVNEYKLGSVDDGIDLMAVSRMRNEFYGLVEKSHICGKCWARNTCNGGCPANSIRANHDVKIPDSKKCWKKECEIEAAVWLISEIMEKCPQELSGFLPADKA